MFEARSALAECDARTDHAGLDGQRTLRLGEVRGGHLLQLGVFPGAMPAVTAAVDAVLGTSLPASPIIATELADHRIFRIAQDQYWVLTPNASLARRLRAAVPADAGSVTSLDGARVRLLIEGATAQRLLGQLLSIDLDRAMFPAGHFAQTGIHHVGGLLHHARTDRYEYLTLRTYAVSVLEIIADAARPFGYQTFNEEI